MKKTRGIRRYPLLALVAFAALGCSSGETPGEGSTAPESALQAFDNAFRNGDYGAVDGLIERLDAAAAADPSNRGNVLFSALARMWKVGEARRDPAFDLPQQAPIALEALEQFILARDLMPDDARIPAWIGFMRAEIGRAVQNPDIVSEGLTELDASVDRFQTFTHFVRALSLVQLPTTDPRFAQAPEDMWAVLEACGYPVDRSNLDFAYPVEVAAPPAHICRDTPIAQHNWKGYFLHAGDIFSKAGDAQTSAAFWQNAKKSPTFAEWRYAGAIEDRILHAEERARLFADDDPANDPELFIHSGNVCVACHAD